MSKVMGYLGWLLDPADRERLLVEYPPLFNSVVAHHVTLRSGVSESEALPAECRARIVGRATDHVGVDALVVEIDGTVHRPDDMVYHITWSLDRHSGYRPFMSNRVIACLGWTSLEPRDIILIPRFFPDQPSSPPSSPPSST